MSTSYHIFNWFLLRNSDFLLLLAVLQGIQTAKLTHHKIKPLIAPYQGSPILLWKRDTGDDQK